MKRRTRFLRTLGIFATAMILTAQTASADLASDTSGFMKYFTGHWDGQGVRTLIDSDGSKSTVRFEMKVDVAPQAPTGELKNAWHYEARLLTETGRSEIADFTYAIREDRLLRKLNSVFKPPFETTEVLGATEDALSYRITRVNSWTGRPYSVTRSWSVVGAGLISMEETVEAAGFTQSVDHVILKRW